MHHFLVVTVFFTILIAGGKVVVLLRFTELRLAYLVMLQHSGLKYIQLASLKAKLVSTDGAQ